MPDGFKYDLELNNTGFEKPAKESTATVEKLGEKATETKKALEQTGTAAETTAEWISRVKKEAYEAAKALENTGGALRNDAKPALEETGKAAERAADGLKAGGQSVSSMARDMAGLKQMGLSLVMSGMAMSATALAEGLAKASPEASAAASAIGNIAAVAAQGSAFGPWGAAIAGTIGLVKELAENIDLTGGAAERTANAAAAAQDMYNRKVAEHVQLLKDLGKAAAENTQAWQADQKERSASNAAAGDRSQAFQASKAALALEARRIAAGDLTGKDAVKATAQIDKDTVDQKYGQQGQRLQSKSDSAKDLVDRNIRAKQDFEKQLAYTPKNDDKRQAELNADISTLAKELAPLQKAAQEAANELDSFKTTSAQLAAAEKANIDAKTGQSLKKEDKKAEDEKFAEHDKARAAANAKSKEKDAAAETAGKTAQSELEKKKSALKGDLGTALDAAGGDSAGAPRPGRDPSAGPRRIQGAISKNTFGPKQITDRMRDTGMMMQRARKVADSKEEGPATAKQVELLGRILRSLEKANAKPAKQ